MTSASHPNRFLAIVFAIASVIFSAAFAVVAVALRVDAALIRYARHCRHCCTRSQRPCGAQR